MTISIDATYSAEDNKLRLYASERLDADLYERARALGFRWASKQELFVAPAWTPQREDFCLELADEITAEQSTLVERAEAKAERLDALSTKRANQANAFHNAAKRIAERFEFGQPILVGHHSERRARKDQQSMHRHMDQSVLASRAVTYWGNRAEGVERHANRKANEGVRARRIKGLLKDLRDFQRQINHAHRCADLWLKITQIENDTDLKTATERLSGSRIGDNGTCPMDTWNDLVDGRADHRITANELAASWAKATANVNIFRWIDHLLNRLAFERSELGPVQRYEGDITAPVLQAFAREHGAHKPKATPNDEGGWLVESSVPLPAHLADGSALTLTVSDWCELMESVGYSVPPKAPRTRANAQAKAPIVNPNTTDAERLQALWNASAKNSRGEGIRASITDQSVLHITQSLYSHRSGGTYASYKTIELDEKGQMIWPSRRREQTATAVCRVRVCTSGGSLYSADSVIVLDDKPYKALPIQWAETVEVSA